MAGWQPEQNKVLEDFSYLCHKNKNWHQHFPHETLRQCPPNRSRRLYKPAPAACRWPHPPDQHPSISPPFPQLTLTNARRAPGEIDGVGFQGWGHREAQRPRAARQQPGHLRPAHPHQRPLRRPPVRQPGSPPLTLTLLSPLSEYFCFVPKAALPRFPAICAAERRGQGTRVEHWPWSTPPAIWGRGLIRVC